jgi:CRISPR type III-associated protein (TIGR04423 family)
LWWSDDQLPKVYKNEILPDWPANTANPFIIEGKLYDATNQKSYSIRFVDGDYLVNCFDLSELKDREFIRKDYLPNRLDGVKKLCFKEFWKPEPDTFCEEMPVLQPAENVFIGFNEFKL